jgi:hypothetical protein
MKKFFSFLAWSIGICCAFVTLGIVSRIAQFFFKLGWELVRLSK